MYAIGWAQGSAEHLRIQQRRAVPMPFLTNTLPSDPNMWLVRLCTQADVAQMSRHHECATVCAADQMGSRASTTPTAQLHSYKGRGV